MRYTKKSFLIAPMLIALSTGAQASKEISCEFEVLVEEVSPQQITIQYRDLRAGQNNGHCTSLLDTTDIARNTIVQGDRWLGNGEIVRLRRYQPDSGEPDGSDSKHQWRVMHLNE